MLKEFKKNAVVYEHCMHMELGQTRTELSYSKVSPFGYAGINYSAEYKVTVRKFVPEEPKKENANG